MRAALALLMLACQQAGQPAPALRVFAPMPYEAVVKTLGAPAATVATWELGRGEPGSFGRLVAAFDHDGQARRIDLHFTYPISRDWAMKQFPVRGLSGPVARTTIDGRRVEYFLEASASFNYAGIHEDAGVASISRYGPGIFDELVRKHPHIPRRDSDGHRIVGSTLAVYAADSREQCLLDCEASRGCRGFTAAPSAGAAVMCHLMAEPKEVVPAAGHYSVVYGR